MTKDIWDISSRSKPESRNSQDRDDTLGKSGAFKGTTPGKHSDLWHVNLGESESLIFAWAWFIVHRHRVSNDILLFGM